MKLFYTRHLEAVVTPPVVALLVWALWFTGYMSSYLAGEVTDVAALAKTFVFFEAVGVALGTVGIRGWTKSEVTWWAVPWAPVRLLLAGLEASGVMILVNPYAGCALFLWLAPHYVLRGKAWWTPDRPEK